MFMNHLVISGCNIGVKLHLTLLVVDNCHICLKQLFSLRTILNEAVALHSRDGVKVSLLPLVQAVGSVTKLEMSAKRQVLLSQRNNNRLLPFHSRRQPFSPAPLQRCHHRARDKHSLDECTPSSSPATLDSAALCRELY